MNKISDYALVTEPDPGSLSVVVQKLLREGYEPLGGICVVAPVVNESPAPLYAQAMIKRAASN